MKSKAYGKDPCTTISVLQPGMEGTVSSRSHSFRCKQSEAPGTFLSRKEVIKIHVSLKIRVQLWKDQRNAARGCLRVIFKACCRTGLMMDVLEAVRRTRHGHASAAQPGTDVCQELGHTTLGDHTPQAAWFCSPLGGEVIEKM